MSRSRRALLLALLAVALGGVGVVGFSEWRARTMARREQTALARAEVLLNDGKPAEALALVEAFARPTPAEAWQRLEIRALTASQNLPRLVALFDRTPARVIESEEASVLLARAFLHARKQTGFDRLRQAWRGREQHPDAWLALDSDALVLADKPREAEALLRSHKLPGEMDATRLVRLALATAKRDLPEAWNLLRQAAALQPKNPDVRSFRGQILEMSGRIELARVEYVAALVATPGNPLLRDQLADFYLRNHSHDLAFDTWTQAVSLPTLDFIWLKARFWSRVLRPVDFPSSAQPPSGELEPLAGHLAGLKAGQFFDATTFNQLPRAGAYAAQRQEVFWLRLLDALAHHRETEALDLLKLEPARLQTWDPDLAGALVRILCYRQKQSLNPAGFAFSSAWPETNRPTFFALLEKSARQAAAAGSRRPALPPELDTLLRGPNAFSAAILAAGWREAAIQLRPDPQLSPSDPEWLTSGFAQALRMNRSPRAALAFLGEGPLPPAAALVRAEIRVEEGRRDAAIAELNSLATLDSGVGFRAALLLALNAAEQGQAEAARQCIARQPLLAQADLGKEVLARLALAEGRVGEAEQIYRGIVRSSVEAKAWFARRAYARQDWKEARQLTNELLELMPDSVQLRENLLAIDQAEARS